MHNMITRFSFINFFNWPLLLLSSSARWGPEAAWGPARAWVRGGRSSAGRTSPHAAAGRPAVAGRWSRGKGPPGPGGKSTPQREAWGGGRGCESGAACSTAESCRVAGRARRPASLCGTASQPLGGPSGRPAPASAVWLFCSETRPAGTRTGYSHFKIKCAIVLSSRVGQLCKDLSCSISAVSYISFNKQWRSEWQCRN